MGAGRQTGTKLFPIPSKKLLEKVDAFCKFCLNYGATWYTTHEPRPSVIHSKSPDDLTATFLRHPNRLQ